MLTNIGLFTRRLLNLREIALGANYVIMLLTVLIANTVCYAAYIIYWNLQFIKNASFERNC